MSGFELLMEIIPGCLDYNYDSSDEDDDEPEWKDTELAMARGIIDDPHFDINAAFQGDEDEESAPLLVHFIREDPSVAVSAAKVLLEKFNADVNAECPVSTLTFEFLESSARLIMLKMPTNRHPAVVWSCHQP